MPKRLPDGGYALSGLQNLFHRGNVPHRLPDGAGAYPACKVPAVPAATLRKCNIQNHYLTDGYY
jgi:hypothetical protein